MTNDPKDNKAYQTLVVDLVENILHYADDPGKCAEYTTTQIRELIGVRMVAIVSVEGETDCQLTGICPPRKEADWNKPEIQSFVASVLSYETPKYIDPNTDAIGKSLSAIDIGKSFVIPLIVGSEKVGMLILLDLLDEGGDIQSILLALTKAASVLALILKNSLLYITLEQRVNERTEQLKTKNAELLQSEERFRHAMEETPFPMMIHAEDGEVLAINRTWTDLTGYSHADIPTIDLWTEQAYGVNKQVVIEEIETLYSLERRKPEGEYEVTCKNGSKVIWEFSSVSIGRLPDGRRTALSMASDVTERKKAENAVAASNKLLQTIINTAPMRVFWKDTALRYLGCNSSFALDVGFADPEDLIGKDDFQLVWKEQAELYRADDRHVMESGIPKLSYDEPQTTPEGKQIWLRTSKVPLQNEANETIGILGIYEDITRYKQTEVDIIEQRNLARNYFQTAGVLLCVLNPEGEIIHINKKGLDILGYDEEEELLGRNWFDFALPNNIVGEVKGVFHKLMSGNIELVEYYENPILAKNGEERMIAFHNSLLRDKDGNISGILFSGEDITFRKKAEQDLQDKNAELERFTYTVSHDLKSPLITICTYAGMIKKEMDSGEYDLARDDLKWVERAVEKMTDLLNDLLELSRIGRVINTPKRVDINLLVKDVLSQLSGLLDQKEIELVVNQNLPEVTGDSKRIDEVFQNLIENAIKYMGDQTAPRIEIGVRQDGKENVFFVKDNGIGIDPSHHELVFGLFNKLNPKSDGTGVGLALVKRIIDVHGGRVWVESEGSNKGSCFSFTLPNSAAYI